MAAPASGRGRNYKVITFYSFKGGVGRSMALANCAALLAGRGHRVLIVDFDLEAPGLGRYFDAVPRHRPRAGGGLVDLFVAHQQGEALDWRSFLVPIALPATKGSLSLLPAGGGSGDYVQLVQSLNWDRLFEEHALGDYLCTLRESWREEFDFVLIDSRTGMSDIGGICTILLPDALVMLFTANEQSISGTAEVVRRARAAQETLPVVRSRLVAIPILSRDDRRTEYEQSEKWRLRIADTMQEFFSDWVWKGLPPTAVLQRLYLPQIAYWSFGERLPVIERPAEIEDPSSLGAAYQRLAQLLESDLNWEALEAGSALSEESGPTVQASRQTARKNIILFSDGTGNSSAKLFKTNVWRTYEALDLGPAPPDKRRQIAFYDNGVGTSGLRPLALLGGIFGFGLRRNILEIYRYACRNYVPAPGQEPGQQAQEGGDEIFGFGFSRGAFTMRLVIALIADQGLVVAASERELNRKTADAYRAFRSSFHPRMWKLPTRLWRGWRSLLLSAWRALRSVEEYDRRLNFHPKIGFVGVWDTVAAYGGPIVEITRGIDNWLYALSMPDYHLSPKVLSARHALAIDDSRDAFHPLLWDEVHEQQLVATGEVEGDRLQQVWFTGMHADVGGGYPDESLSYVSLLWMLNEAEKAGLRSLNVVTDRYRALANSAGPMHDSRSGPGAYYRYQPRNIGAWLHPPDSRSIVHDPQITDERGNPKGLLTRVQVHESVIARISSGTDRYAPFTLPAELDIVPPQRGGEASPQPDSDTSTVPSPPDQKLVPLVSAQLRSRLSSPDSGAARADSMASVWDLVWWRRVVYFATLAATFALLLMPWWVSAAGDAPLLADGRNWLGSIIRLLAVVTPDFLDPLIETLANNSFYFLLFVALIVALTATGRGIERAMRDKSSEVWRRVLEGEGLPRRERSMVERVRTSKLYRRPMRLIKWHILPALSAASILLLLLWLAAGGYVQLRLTALERSDVMCRRSTSVESLEVHRMSFAPNSLCQGTARTVQRGQRYVVDLEVIEPWRDGSIAATPAGLSAGEIGLPGFAAVPFRRVITADYLQPVVEIRRGPGAAQLGDRVYIQPLRFRQEGDRPTSWRTEFKAERDGELMIFVNDAVPALWPLGGSALDMFYRSSRFGNRGSACVTIRRADRLRELAPAAEGACLGSGDIGRADAMTR